MTRLFSAAVFASIVVLASVIAAEAQVDEVCSATGNTPSLDSPFAHVPYIFGHVRLKGSDPAAKPSKVVVVLTDTGQAPVRWTVDRSGAYCFRRLGTAGTLLVEVDGVEAARRSLPTFGSAQQQEDFDVYANTVQRPKPPSAVSAKFFHPPNEKTADLYFQAAERLKGNDLAGSINALRQIIAIDPDDFVAWTELGNALFRQSDLPAADSAYRRSLELRVDYTPGWLAVGQLRVAQKRFDAAAEIFKHALELDPENARTYRLMGEAYLQAKKGTLGAEALDRAIELDPIGMADCHLLLARLYDLAGAKERAVGEYKLFLAKVPDFPDKKKLERYIKENGGK